MQNLLKLSSTIKYYFLLGTFLIVSACGQGESEQQMLLDAKSYLDEDNTSAATIKLKNVLKTNNENAEAHFLLGNIHLELGNFTISEKEFNHATRTGWDQEQTQTALARIYLNTKGFQKLIDDIPLNENWTKETKANILAMHALARAELDETTLANTTLTEARNLKNDALEVLITTAMFQFYELQSGNPTETLKLALSAHPENSRVLLLLAANHVQNKEYTPAIELYNNVLSIEPKNSNTLNVQKARIGLARIQIKEKKLDDANTTLAPLLKNKDKNLEAKYLSAFISFNKSDYSHAETHIRDILTVLPTHPPSQLLMGKIKYALKELEQAAQHLSLYLKAVPNDLSVQILLTKTYIDLSRPNQASLTLAPILKHNPKNTLALTLRSQIAFINNNVDKGIDTLEDALEIDPKNTILQKQLLKIYIANGNPAKAFKKLKTFESLDSSTPEIQKIMISAYLAEGNINQAINITNQILDANSKDPSTLALKGNLLAAQNNLSLSREYFDQARQIQKDLPSAIIGLAQLEEREGNIDQAMALYKILIDSKQAGTMPMLVLSKLAEKQNRIDDMLSWLEKARTSSPTDLKSRLILASYYLKQSKPNKAETYTKEALKISPEDIEAMTIHGRTLITQKRYNEALPTLKKLANNQPDSITPHLLLGNALSQLGLDKKARHHFQVALKKQPNNVSASVFMAKAEYKAENYNESIKYAKNLQQTKSAFITGYLLEGNIWLARKNYEKAYSAFNLAWQQQQTASLAKNLFISSKPSAPFETAIKPLLAWLEQYPEDSNTRLFLATAYQSEQLNDEAILQYENILKEMPDSSPALNNLAWLYSLNNNPKALSMAERAYRLAPENPDIQDTYGWILNKHGQAEKGLRLIEQALQTLPNNTEVLFHYADALINSGNETKAKQVLKKLLNQNKVFESKEQAQNLLLTITD